MSSPAAGKALTAALLAADFGPKNPFAQRVIAASSAHSYYSLLLDCLSARATGGPCPTGAESLNERLAEYGLPNEPCDLLKDLYLQLFSRRERHALGEYYTPDWLAERLLAATLRTDVGKPAMRILDPACGSGTFLVLAIKYVRRRVASGEIRASEALDLILRNIIGFDVQPLAVQAARTNYLLALGDLLRLTRDPIDVPVYQFDSVVAPPAPFAGSCDFIVGNPPWVNWQNLPEDFRRATIPLWEHYGLFPKRPTGMQTILGAAKYDLSMLLIYVVADRFLRHGGRLGFIVSQSLFKAAAAGQGFRRFQLPDGTPLCVCEVEDLVKLKPFDSAANRTATVVLEKGRETQYPVEYRVHAFNQQYDWRARPISADPSSSWIAARPETLLAITRLLGPSPYRAREGVNTGGANAVFWLDVKPRSRGMIEARNLIEGARKPVPSTRIAIESACVYPLLRGQNVRRWSAVPEHSILITHQPGMKLRAIPEAVMKRESPRAFSYLKRFEKHLRERPAFKRYFKPEAPFYSLFNIGEYTFAPWKVVWREQALPFTAAVVTCVRKKVVVPDHKLMIVPVESEVEAHYLCGALNSLPVCAAVAAYTVETQINTHVLDHIAVPRFDRANPAHRSLAAASRRAHFAAAVANHQRLRQAELTVNRSAARLWSLDDGDLAEMRRFLREIGCEARDKIGRGYNPGGQL